jgi:hypothetical protein
MITKENLEQAFKEQRALTDSAIEGPGLMSYIRNLGFDDQAVLEWVNGYALSAVARSRPDWGEEDVDWVAAWLIRALALGLVLGRQTQP